jgi:hypothetical protein
MKIIEGFSWAIFILCKLNYFLALVMYLAVLSFDPVFLFSGLVIALTSRSVAMGNQYAWSDYINDLPWFGEMPGYYQAPYGYGGQQMYLPPPGAIQQQPGHSVVIQPGHHGQPTTVQQIPNM